MSQTVNRTVKLRLPANCETCELVALSHTGEHLKIQVVLDTQFEITNEALAELVSDCRRGIAIAQDKHGKFVSAAHGLVNENRCHWVASINCFVLTDSEDYAMECYELFSGDGETQLVGGVN